MQRTWLLALWTPTTPTKPMGRLERPRPWHPLDASFLTRGTIESLLDQYGAAGALAIVALIGEAKGAVGGGKKGKFEVLDWRYSFLGRRIRVDADQAKAIVHSAAEDGLVTVLEEQGDHFKLSLDRWYEWEVQDPTAAQRQRRHRAQQVHDP